jgi:hypothetical protein
VDSFGIAVSASSILNARCELFLCRTDEQLPSIANDNNAGAAETDAAALPDSVWSIVISYLPPSREVVRCTEVSLVFHREIPCLFGRGVLTTDEENINFHVGWGRWYWEESKLSKWHSYSYEANSDIEKAFQTSKSEMTVQICEVGQVPSGSRKGKPKKKVCRVDLEALEQSNLSGRGSAFRIHRRPRAWL